MSNILTYSYSLYISNITPIQDENHEISGIGGVVNRDVFDTDTADTHTGALVCLIWTSCTYRTIWVFDSDTAHAHRKAFHAHM